MQEQTFNINSADMASLLMLTVAVEDIISSGEVSADILDELELIQPVLRRIVYGNV